MPNPITTQDPILSSIRTQVPTAFLGDVVDLINRSPNLLSEINQLDATRLAGGGTAVIELQTGASNAGNTFYHSPVINIGALPSYDDSQVIYGGASLTAGQTEAITPAGTFVGLLAHEIAHWGDAQLGPIYTPGDLTGYPIEQAVATEFASEGKAAYSQFTAMQQIQSSEATNPVPAGMANGNVLFNVSSNALNDTGLLQQVQTYPQTGEPSAAVSYLGSRFWNVAVDGGTYLSTMWDGYGGAGAVDDLGIVRTQITAFQVDDDQNGRLASCTIQTGGTNGLTYQIACATPGQQQALIMRTATATPLATVTTVVPASGPMQLSIIASNFTFAAAASAVATVQGNGDTLSLGSQDRLTISGSGNSVTGASGSQITVLADGSSVQLSGAGAGVQLDGAQQTLSASGARIAMAQASSALVSGSGNMFTLAGSDSLTIAGNADTVSGSGASLTLSGPQSVTVRGSLDTLSLSGRPGDSQSVTLSGNQDRLFGATGGTALQLALSGNNALVSLVAGSATITGGTATTTVFGGASAVDYSGGGIVVMGSGAATVAGAGSGARETVFGGSGGLVYQGSAEYADVIAGGGSTTIAAGSGGGWYAGGSAGNNLLTAAGGGTVLEAGGNGDTLTGAAGGGSYLLAGAGNETLRGGNQSGISSIFLGSGADQVTAGHGGSVIVAGTGAATIVGGGGHDQIWGGTGGADLFTAGNGGQLEIHGFRAGTDHLSTGGQSMVAVSQTAAGTSFTLASGATVTLVGIDAQPGSVFA